MTPIFPAVKVFLSIKNTVIQNNIEHHVKLNCFGSKLEMRFISKSNLPNEDIQHIHWLAIEQAFCKLLLQEKLATFNLLHQKWPTNMKLASWDSNKDPLCQCCTTIEKTFHHIFQCKSHQATKTHAEAIKKLKEALRCSCTAPITQRAIVQCLLKHRKGYEDMAFNDVVVPKDQKVLTLKVLNKLTSLGYSAFLQ